MANNYYDATGVLILEQVTPIITALFEDFNLDPSYPGNGRAYIALISESATPCWEDVIKRFSRMGAELGILPSETPDETPDTESVLCAWAEYFHADQDEELQNLIEHHGFEDAVDLEALFLLATRFDDGHRLTAIEYEGSWYCSKPRLFEFGGDACFYSREVRLFDSSREAREFGRALHEALTMRKISEASGLVNQAISRLLGCIQNRHTRETLRQLAIDRLTEFPAVPTTEQ